MFDTLTYTKKLREAGVPEKQAEVQAETLSDFIESDLATKKDLKELEVSLKRDIEQIKAEMATKVELERATTSIIKWTAGAVFASVGIVVAIVKLMN